MWDADDPIVRSLLRSFLTKVKKKRKREARALRKQIALLKSDLDYTTEQLQETRAAKASKNNHQQVAMLNALVQATPSLSVSSAGLVLCSKRFYVSHPFYLYMSYGMVSSAEVGLPM